MIKKPLILTIVTLVITGYSYPAIAVESLDFKSKMSVSLGYQIDSFLGQSYKTDLSQYYVASTDLNRDGIEEHILRQKRCDTNQGQCPHLIIAEKENEIVLLSRISARNLMIGGSFSHGVKDILAFNNEINDYNFDIYVWSPSQKMYILKAK